MKNFLLKYRYRFFASLLPRKQFTGMPDWEENWAKPSYRVVNNFMYAGNSYTSGDCVRVEPDGLHLKVLPTAEFRDHWSGKHYCTWKIGWINYRDVISEVYGTWVLRFKAPQNPDNFCAWWFLRYPYTDEASSFPIVVDRVDGNSLYLRETPAHLPKVNYWLLDRQTQYPNIIERYDAETRRMELEYMPENISAGDVLRVGGDFIIPEVDAMEHFKRFAHSVNYGYSFDKYKLHTLSNHVGRPVYDGRVYEVACEIFPHRYTFYLDGIKTAEYTKGLSDRPLYPIINNAVHPGIYAGNIDDFVVKELKFFRYVPDEK